MTTDVCGLQFLCSYYWFFCECFWCDRQAFFNGQFFYRRKYSRFKMQISFTHIPQWLANQIHLCRSRAFIYWWLIFWKRMVSQPASKGILAQEKNFFNCTTWLFLSVWRKLYSQSSPQNIFVLLMIWHLGTAFNSKLCHKLPRSVFEKHLVSGRAFRVFKPMQFLSTWEMKEHFLLGSGLFSPHLSSQDWVF